MSRRWRIVLLLSALVLIGSVTLWERLWVRSWSRPLAVAIYPIAMDGASVQHVGKLKQQDFAEIAAYVAGEATRWRKQQALAPKIVLHAPIAAFPPLPQGQRSGLDAIKYTLRLRWYAFRQTAFWNSLGSVRLFVLYHDPKHNVTLPHSLGLQKALLGVVHVFASDEQAGQNNVVITHELLHTLGATDKYDADGHPIHPEGFADYASQQRYPQEKAEIMAGRVPVGERESRIPRNLAETVVGYKTASEIGW
jgi:hypothetical protein